METGGHPALGGLADPIQVVPPIHRELPSPRHGGEPRRESARALRLRAALDDALAAVRCPREAPNGTLSIGRLLDRSLASHGLVVALVVLTAVPFVGVSGLFGFAVALVGLQVAVGRQSPWLPARVRRIELSARTIELIVRWLSRTTSWMTHLVRPRLPGCLRGPAKALVGLGLVILGVGLALPVPVPGANLVFIVSILAYAVGLIEEDGILVMVAHAATLTLVLASHQLAVLAGALL
jgi:hypothetical protein